MAFDITKSVDIIDTMESYIASIRPEPEIRPLLDLGYELHDQSVILNEIRPAWDNPSEIRAFSYAKATFVKGKNVWKIYWKRADLKWHTYKAQPTVIDLIDFLKIVDEDKYGCFKG